MGGIAHNASFFLTDGACDPTDRPSPSFNYLAVRSFKGLKTSSESGRRANGRWRHSRLSRGEARWTKTRTNPRGG